MTVPKMQTKKIDEIHKDFWIFCQNVLKFHNDKLLTTKVNIFWPGSVSSTQGISTF